MATIKDASRLVKRIALANLMSKKGLAITPMLSGPHGIGKSMILQSAAKDLGGYCFVVEGGSLKEGEITGLPFAFQNGDGTSEVSFVKYNMINRIFQLEKYYYEKAITTGFLDGNVKLIEKENGKYLYEYGKETLVSTKELDILKGSDNTFKFGELLSPETKLKLIESGEIKMVMLFIDELNRTELQTQKELMNIILNKCINGYELPWFVFIASAVNPNSQNSSYATNELDPAQLDRFLKIKVNPKIDEWVDYAINSSINSDFIEALVSVDGVFMTKDSSLEDTTDLTPTPRSWEICAHIFNTIEYLNETKYFNSEEREMVNQDLRTLIQGKVGPDAGRTILQALDRRNENIKPIQILDGKSDKIDKDIKNKFLSLRHLSQKVIADNVLTYVESLFSNEYKDYKTTKDEEKKKKFNRTMNQFKEFISSLDTATQIAVIKNSFQKYGTKFAINISSFISSEFLANLNEVKMNIAKLGN